MCYLAIPVIGDGPLLHGRSRIGTAFRAGQVMNAISGMLIVVSTGFLHNHQIPITQFCGLSPPPRWMWTWKTCYRCVYSHYVPLLNLLSVILSLSYASFLSILCRSIRSNYSSPFFQTVTQSPYSPPHGPHLPSEIEAFQKRVEIERRAASIDYLNQRISKLEENHRQLQEKELETLRPIMDQIHANICEIQREMARRWTEYTSRMATAQEATETKVTTLQKRITSLEKENGKSQYFLTPIRRLPIELLAEIFAIAIESHGQSRFDMMRVCRSWRATVLNMARIWSQLTIRPLTSREQAEFVLERTRQVPLELSIDSESIYPPYRALREGETAYGGLALAVKTMSRWRSLTVIAFPSEEDIVVATGGGTTGLISARPLEKLETLKIAGPCESDASFGQLLDHVATTSTPRLKHVELASPNAIWFLADQKYRVFFSHLTHFKIDVREMRNPADILPYFENLQVLDAYQLHLPLYSHDVDLPLVRTLRRMSIEMVSVQWMSGRTFPALEDCTIVWPHYPECLGLQGGVDLPVCTQFIYDDHLIEPISFFRLPKLDKMVVRNEAWDQPRGSKQLISVWGESTHTTWLKPRVLHLDTQCHDQYLINALQLQPDLEELVLGLLRPDGLGKKFFNTMTARRLKAVASSSGPNSGSARSNGTSGSHLVAPLVPKLKVFGVRCRRWLKEKEKDVITPLLEKIIQSREKTEIPLQSVKFWPTKETPEDEAKELVPFRA